VEAAVEAVHLLDVHPEAAGLHCAERIGCAHRDAAAAPEGGRVARLRIIDGANVDAVVRHLGEGLADAVGREEGMVAEGVLDEGRHLGQPAPPGSEVDQLSARGPSWGDFERIDRAGGHEAATDQRRETLA